jgi:hypothetical protein
MAPEVCKDKSVDHIINDFQTKFSEIRKNHNARTDNVRHELSEYKLKIRQVLNNQQQTKMSKYHTDMINQFSQLSKQFNELCRISQIELENLLKDYEAEDRCRIVHIVNPYKHIRPTRTGSLMNILFEILY